MSLTKTQLDQFIEREAEKANYPPYFIEAAQLLAPLLLKVLKDFNTAIVRMGIMQDRMMNCHLDSDGKNHGLIDESEAFYHEAREACAQIEAAVASAGRDGQP